MGTPTGFLTEDFLPLSPPTSPPTCPPARGFRETPGSRAPPHTPTPGEQACGPKLGLPEPTWPRLRLPWLLSWAVLLDWGGSHSQGTKAEAHRVSFVPLSLPLFLVFLFLSFLLFYCKYFQSNSFSYVGLYEDLKHCAS